MEGARSEGEGLGSLRTFPPNSHICSTRLPELQARLFHLQACLTGPGPHQHTGNKARAPTRSSNVYSSTFLLFAGSLVMNGGLRDKKKLSFSPHSCLVSGCSGCVLYLKLYRYDESFHWRSRTIYKRYWLEAWDRREIVGHQKTQ